MRSIAAAAHRQLPRSENRVFTGCHQSVNMLRNSSSGAASLGDPIDSKTQVVIVDRHVAAVEPLRLSLAAAGFAVRVITDQNAAIAAIVERPPALVFFDSQPLCNDGVELLGAIRTAARHSGSLRGSIGLIILSASSGEQDVVNSLNLGADDYVIKPYSCREVVARAKAVLRVRSRNHHPPSLICGSLELDTVTTRAHACSRPLVLTPLQFRLLEFLMRNCSKAFSRAQLTAAVWGMGRTIDERTVDVNVQRLRKLLTPPGCQMYITTVRGFGYRMDAPSISRSL